MKRRIVKIDAEKCTGCGLCAGACHEGAIGMVEGRARLVRDDFCDGMGDCLPACPAGAISFEEREAAAYDETAVAAKKREALETRLPQPERSLRNWPVQIKLAPLSAPYYQGARLLVAADCTAYAYAGFHDAFIAGRTALIGCPKLDGVNYAPKLAEIIAGNEICEIIVTRMTVPCCGGLEIAVKSALRASGKKIPLRVVSIGTDGKIAADCAEN